MLLAPSYTFNEAAAPPLRVVRAETLLRMEEGPGQRVRPLLFCGGGGVGEAGREERSWPNRLEVTHKLGFEAEAVAYLGLTHRNRP